MTKEEAKKYIPLVNSPEFPVLLDYVKDRVEFTRKRLENADSMDWVYKYQGALMELRTLEMLRDSVISLARS